MAEFTFTPIFTDPFNVTSNPINAAHWHTIGGGLPNDTDQIEVLNGFATTTTSFQADGQASYLGVLPDDQYVSLQIHTIASTGGFFLYLRGTPQGELGQEYVCAITGPFNDNTDAASITIYAIDQSGGNVPITWVDGAPLDFQQGDVLTFAVQGQENGSLYFFKNGVMVYPQTAGQLALNLNPDGIYSSGFVGLQLNTLAASPAPGDIQVFNFATGSFSVNGSGGGSGNSNNKIFGTIWFGARTPGHIVGTGQRTGIIG